jgi:transketolase
VRNTFIDTLCELAAEDERVWLLCADLGYSVLERFAERFPDRYVNVGVAEQNLTGVAAGLALSGKVVFTYSIANFPVMRCLEQIRNDVCYHNANVKIVAVGGGFAYGTAGYTHHGVEDLAVMRALPQMTVVAPGDPVETRLATRAILQHAGPCYLRLGKGGEQSVYTDAPAFALGRAIALREGTDATIFTTGAMLGEAVKAADALAEQGISAGVVSMPTLRPLDGDAVRRAAERSRLVVAAEEHGAIGGLGSALAEVLASAGIAGARLLHVAATQPPYEIGSQAYLRQHNSLDAASLAAAVRRELVGVRAHE